MATYSVHHTFRRGHLKYLIEVVSKALLEYRKWIALSYQFIAYRLKQGSLFINRIFNELVS